MSFDYYPERDIEIRLQIAKKELRRWKTSLCNEISVGGLYARNPDAHKWKAPFKTLLCRELSFWRVTDLFSQAVFLVENKFILGAITILRSSLETLGLLIYLNLKIQNLIESSIDFKNFESIIDRLLLGSKSNIDQNIAVNVITILEKHSEKRYPGTWDMYQRLSEFAHPNSMGLLNAYSSFDDIEFVTDFENQLNEEGFVKLIEHDILTCMWIFETEYNNKWAENYRKIEEIFAERGC